VSDVRLRDDFVAVKVPATSANLGPGFDSMGLALDLWDEVSVHATTGATSVVVEGEGAGNVEQGEDNLVVRALRLALDRVGAPQVGVRMHCTNRIPHSRGLGSSASAIVAGVTLARALIGDPDALTAEDILAIATEIEGHPDNVAPAISGGVTVSWMDDDGAPGMVHVSGESPIDPVAFIPDFELATSKARAVLPEQVPFTDAKFNLSRAGILAAVLGGQTRVIGAGHDVHDLLMAATEDRLHQDASAVLDVLAHRVEVCRQVDRVRQYTLLILALTLAVELLPPLGNHRKARLIVCEHFDLLTLAV